MFYRRKKHGVLRIPVLRVNEHYIELTSVITVQNNLEFEPISLKS